MNFGFRQERWRLLNVFILGLILRGSLEVLRSLLWPHLAVLPKLEILFNSSHCWRGGVIDMVCNVTAENKGENSSQPASTASP